ncbi:glucose-1-phosphate thymidylyltransferase [Halorubrum alkaliphilum]|uniref:Glucose-1-phosphate thymidylyltransferase n=1 Tax=Halorubrum alkaliphilum TaxID=261290 RepID=A0A8T4GHX5_9EURY|nr:nucleotidyltransferase family protein [Halorubrum alkaliphilum]MBP1923743.1 glucose-1-phosphate thymidylyltransferase [Halorubrum alkaliphilum]
MDAIIPAAGRGTRLGELTDDRPKGLVDVAGKPLLAYALDTAVEAGVDELIVIIGYEGAQIVEQFGDAYRDVPITYVHQREQLGLGHAVLQARHAVDGTFLLVNGDNVFVDGVTPALEAVRAEGVDGVLGVEEVSREVARTTGVIETEEGAITGIVEKPDDPPSQLVTTGCYVLPEETFHACALVQPSAEGEYQLSEAVGLLCRAGFDFETVELGPRVNVNEPGDIEQAAKLVCGIG